jgi:hypothetical protein
MSFLTASPRFLFRTDEGEIDAPTWRRGASLLLAILVVATIVWWLLAPYARHDLDTMPFFQPMVMVAYVYLMAFSFAVILTAICFTNLTAKRLRSRRRPPSLAGLLPLMCLFAGAAHWLQPRVGDDFPIATVITIDILVVAVAIWVVLDCGVLGNPRAPSSN